MKTKFILGGVLGAVIGAAIGLFAFGSIPSAIGFGCSIAAFICGAMAGLQPKDERASH